MSELSANLSLPFIMPAQAQKHVTHNEALAQLDVLVQLSVGDFDAMSPPAAPAESEAYVVSSDATGDWAGKGGRIAAFIGGGWVFLTPRPGWVAVSQTGELRVFSEEGWVGPSVPGIGVGAAPDAANRLTVSGDSSLLTHAGEDHRLTINKASTAATGSLVFQSGWSGRAEMGLAGEDAFSFKVSADGSGWVTALRLDPATGHASGAAVQSAPDDATPGRLMRADFGYSPGNLVGTVGLDGATPTGAVIEAGDGFTRFADGTQICTGAFSSAGVNLSTPMAGGYCANLSDLSFARPFASPPAVSATLGAGVEALVQGVDATASGASLRLWSGVSGPVDVSGHFLCVGRWA